MEFNSALNINCFICVLGLTASEPKAATESQKAEPEQGQAAAPAAQAPVKQLDEVQPAEKPAVSEPPKPSEPSAPKASGGIQAVTQLMYLASLLQFEVSH